MITRLAAIIIVDGHNSLVNDVTTKSANQLSAMTTRRIPADLQIHGVNHCGSFLLFTTIRNDGTMMIASNTGYATITQKIAIPLDDERSARLTVYDIIKKRKILVAITVAIKGFLLK